MKVTRQYYCKQPVMPDRNAWRMHLAPWYGRPGDLGECLQVIIHCVQLNKSVRYIDYIFVILERRPITCKLLLRCADSVGPRALVYSNRVSSISIIYSTRMVLEHYGFSKWACSTIVLRRQVNDVINLHIDVVGIKVQLPSVSLNNRNNRLHSFSTSNELIYVLHATINATVGTFRLRFWWRSEATHVQLRNCG